MILFLDIDGVLHPDPATANEAFCRRTLLWNLLKARPGIHVVISSDWRDHYSLVELTDLILSGGDPALKSRFVGTTRALPGAGYTLGGRERECVTWLAESGFEGAEWFAIDDIAENFLPGSPVLITDHRTGLTAGDIEILLSMIGI